MPKINLVETDAVHTLLARIWDFQCCLELLAVGPGLASHIWVFLHHLFYFNQVLIMALLSTWLNSKAFVFNSSVSTRSWRL